MNAPAKSAPAWWRKKRAAQNRPGRLIETPDRRALMQTVNDLAASGRNFATVRTRALVFLAWGSALRLKECLALNVDQIVDVSDTKRPWRIRSTAYLRPEQSKSRRVGSRQWEGGGTFVITKRAREALRVYLRAAEARGWITWPPAPDCPLFITARGGGSHKRAGQQRLLRRAAQVQWVQLCKRAAISQPYRFHDLRHDALTRVAVATEGDVFKVAAFGRLQSMDTAIRYVHHAPTALTDLADAAEL